MEKITKEYYCDNCGEELSQDDALRQPNGKQLCEDCAEIDGWRPFKTFREFALAGGLDWWFVRSKPDYERYKYRIYEFIEEDNNRRNGVVFDNRHVHSFKELFHYWRRYNPLTGEISIVGVRIEDGK